MNNSSSLLDSLLATNNTSPATKKSAKPQRSTSSAEGFQNTLEQLRPKVAARKPETTAARTGNYSHADSPRPEAREPKPDLPTKARAHSNSQQERHATLTTASDKAHPTTITHKSRTAEASATNGEQLSDEAMSEDGLVSDLPEEVDAALLGVDVSGVDVLSDAQILTTNSGDTILPLEEDAEGILLDLAAQAGIQPVGVAAELGTEIGLAPVLDPAPDTDAILPSVLANPLAGMPGTSLRDSAASPLTPLTTNSLASSALTPELMTQETVPTLALEVDAEVLLVDGELAEGELSDNPDLLLLNAKTIMNKLAEASASSLDKGVTAGELPKALTAAAPAVEALSRLSEAQSPVARGFVVQTGVPVALGQPQWGQAVGERVLWLAAQNVSAAEIRLDPPELGPMQVRVSINQEQVNVSFTSPHPAVREVLDQQLNRLREMFSEQGLNLVDVDVSGKSFAQQDQERGGSRKNGSSMVADEELAPLVSSILVSNRLVDHYA